MMFASKGIRTGPRPARTCQDLPGHAEMSACDPKRTLVAASNLPFSAVLTNVRYLGLSGHCNALPKCTLFGGKVDIAVRRAVAGKLRWVDGLFSIQRSTAMVTSFQPKPARNRVVI